MFRTYNAGERVPGGFYFNTHDWTMHVVAREGEVLMGTEQARYLAFPTLMMVVAAPIVSFAFVIFLPFIGIALLAKVAVDKTAVLLQHAKAAAKDRDIHVRVTK